MHLSKKVTYHLKLTEIEVAQSESKHVKARQRQSLYLHCRRSGYNMFISPLDVHFHRDDNKNTVCGIINDDSDLDNNFEDLILSLSHYDFMKLIKARERALTFSKLLKRIPLPTTII